MLILHMINSNIKFEVSSFSPPRDRSVLFFSRPRSEGWPHHGRTFSIYPCPLSFWLTLPRGVLSTSWCCPSRGSKKCITWAGSCPFQRWSFIGRLGLAIINLSIPNLMSLPIRPIRRHEMLCKITRMDVRTTYIECPLVIASRVCAEF